jgi:protein-tyrosine-phosphatase/DNA-binding transcriptional ArsR family regulator
MNTEASTTTGDGPDVAHRAHVHAALADPSRLRIVDTLSLGDASPSDLQHLLAMPSNLLAHHLRTLEDAGLVERRRSEADRRRSYLQLVPAALDGLLPHGLVAVPRVVFVCTANSARSQLAAALWERASTIPATSAGTHPAERVAPGAVAVARRHRLPLTQAHPRPLVDVLHPDDYVVTVCDNAHEELDRTDHVRRQRLHWSVPDPVRARTDDAFEHAYDDLARRVTQLAPRLTAS